MESAEEKTPVLAVIAGIDDGVARVLVGESRDEWFFPLQMIPGGVAVGTPLYMVADGDRYAVIGIADERPHADVRSMDERLYRMRSDRRGIGDLDPVVDE